MEPLDKATEAEVKALQVNCKNAAQDLEKSRQEVPAIIESILSQKLKQESEHIELPGECCLVFCVIS